MGAQQTIIKYANNIQYIGKVEGKNPQGKGKVIFSAQNHIQGNFSSGFFKQGKLVTNQYIYQGEFQNNKITGNGKIDLLNGIIYEGNFNDGKFVSGKIVKKNKNNEKVYEYSGTIQGSGFLSGNGELIIYKTQIEEDKYIVENIKMSGKFVNGNLKEKGTYYFENGDVYEGQFIKGIMTGTGKYISNKFDTKGQFQNNVACREHIIQFKNGDKFQGQLKEGQMHGWGKYTYGDGTIYLGNFYCGSMWGSCTIDYKQGDIQRYEGEVDDGLWNGIGIIYFNNGVIYKGYFQNGSKNGNGVIIYGKNRYKCLFIMDKLIGEIKLID